MRKILLASLAVIALVAPSPAVALNELGPSITSPRTTETPGTAEARKQVEIGRSITDPYEYLAFVKSLADYEHACGYGDKP